MQYMFYIIAHTNESHGTGLETAVHTLGWHVQIPLFLCGVGIVFSLVWLITRKIDTALLVTAFGILITGLGSYAIAPIVSVVAITLGFVISLFVTLVGFSATKH